jgi:hypothetical protein
MQHLQPSDQQQGVDGNRNKLFTALTKKLVNFEQEVGEKDAQLRAYQTRDAAMTLELHNTTVALGQERSLLNLANTTISKLEAKIQEILPQFEYHLEQQRQVASLTAQLSLSNATLDDLKLKCERLETFKHEQVTMDSSRTVTDREMLGSLIREVQSERTRAEQTRTRILEQVINTQCERKQRTLVRSSFKHWKCELRFCRKYNAVFFKSAQSHGTHLLQTVLQNWRFIWPVEKYLSSSCDVRRMQPLLSYECRHGQERRCLSLRLLRNVCVARMRFMVWARIVRETQAKGNFQTQELSGASSHRLMKSRGARDKVNSIDTTKYGILILNLRVKSVLKRLLLVWHHEASTEGKHRKKISDIESDAAQVRLQLANEMQMLESQRKSYEGEIDKIRTRSHKIAQRTVETLFGSNTKLMLQSCFNRLKDCALEGRSRRIEELQETMLHFGKNTALKLLQYETAITMATDYSIRRLLPEIAFLTWKKATMISQADFLKTRVADLESLQGLPNNDAQNATIPESLSNEHVVKSNRSDQSNSKFEHGKTSGTPRSIEKSGSTPNIGDPSLTAKIRGYDESVTDASLLLPEEQHQTLSQLASFLIPSALEQFAIRSPLLAIDHAASKNYPGEIHPQSSSLMDLQQKLNRLESRWASIRLNPS